MAAESQSASSPTLAAFDPSLDHFARLGLERSWALDRDILEANYLERSRIVHPDRHAGADAATRRAALEHSAALNEAYRVLRDQVLRAEYLVRLGGVDLDSSDTHPNNAVRGPNNALRGAPHPSQAFLIEMIERRDRLDEPGTDLDALFDEVEAELDEVFDGAITALAQHDIQAAAAALVHRRYLQRFCDEIDAARS